MRDDSQAGNRDRDDAPNPGSTPGTPDRTESTEAQPDTQIGSLPPDLPADEANVPNGGDPVPASEPFGGLLNRNVAGRPLIVYLVLFAGAATLLLLLAIVWISATQDGKDRPKFCTPISAQEAQQSILGGQVERMIVLVDEDNPLTSLTGVRLEMADDTCREPQQGADARDDLYRIIGAAEFYNTFGEQRMRISYQRQDIPVALLSTSTPTPTATLPPTETPVVTETPTGMPAATETSTPEPGTPTPEGTATETATETTTPEAVGSPVLASPHASPFGAATTGAGTDAAS